MPTPINGNQANPKRPSAGTAHTVKPGETLSIIAAKLLGDAKRWPELYAANKHIIGSNPNHVRAGMVLKLPSSTSSAPAEEAAKGVLTPRQSPFLVDRLEAAKRSPFQVDRFEATKPPVPSKAEPADKPEGPSKAEGPGKTEPGPKPEGEGKKNNIGKAYGDFVARQTEKLRTMGVEIDCADLAAKLLTDFAKEKGIPNPLGPNATWHVYRPESPGGLPKVEGPNYFLPAINADNLAKRFTVAVEDRDGDGVRGFDRASGAVDVGDLRAGDILFYDWDKDGVVNHTVNVLGTDDDGTVHLAFGTYNNLGTSGPVTWENLDLQKIQLLDLKPGTSDYDKWLGEGNMIHGVRRFNLTEEKSA